MVEKVENPVKRYFQANEDDRPYLVAKRAGLGQATIYKIVKGTAYMLPTTMHKLVKATAGRRKALTMAALQRWNQSRLEWQI